MLTTFRLIVQGELVWIGLKELPGEWVKATVDTVAMVQRMTLCQVTFREECAAGLLEIGRFVLQDVASEVVPWAGWAPGE
jgi:hypothetical protein